MNIMAFRCVRKSQDLEILTLKWVAQCSDSVSEELFVTAVNIEIKMGKNKACDRIPNDSGQTMKLICIAWWLFSHRDQRLTSHVSPLNHRGDPTFLSSESCIEVLCLRFGFHRIVNICSVFGSRAISIGGSVRRFLLRLFCYLSYLPLVFNQHNGWNSLNHYYH
jgi:hypothetical protein